jgi:Tuberculosis necrotizing toxin
LTSRRLFLTALASAAAAALSFCALWVAGKGAQPPQARPACSASHLDGDYRLGPTTTPNAGPVGLQLFGYSRLADLAPRQFIARYWDSSANSWKYPPDNGFLVIAGNPVEYRLTLKPGSPLDRYGSVYGGYLAPAGTPYWARSLPPSSLDNAPGFTCNYHTYKVLRAFQVEAGPAAPAFGQPGLGLQYQLVAPLLPGYPVKASVHWLLVHRYLAATN